MYGRPPGHPRPPGPMYHSQAGAHVHAPTGYPHVLARHWPPVHLHLRLQRHVHIAYSIIVHKLASAYSVMYTSPTYSCTDEGPATTPR